MAMKQGVRKWVPAVGDRVTIVTSERNGFRMPQATATVINKPFRISGKMLVEVLMIGFEDYGTYIVDLRDVRRKAVTPEVAAQIAAKHREAWLKLIQGTA